MGKDSTGKDEGKHDKNKEWITVKVREGEDRGEDQSKTMGKDEDDSTGKDEVKHDKNKEWITAKVRIEVKIRVRLWVRMRMIVQVRMRLNMTRIRNE